MARNESIEARSHRPVYIVIYRMSMSRYRLSPLISRIVSKNKTCGGDDIHRRRGRRHSLCAGKTDLLCAAAVRGVNARAARHGRAAK